ncbi:HYC_CC_PP family protein [Tenacibaculum sp. M341]|uniref:HYC_CC_PP family protein n=2 Tax=Tenacibaculum TaxID=104267 RepID=UPI00104E5CFD|nr:hypothetical protein [Tenacibaculum sp. M341]TCI91383.1 hypothetical protein EYW44_10525 [Tenacibaculum sp. M341]
MKTYFTKITTILMALIVLFSTFSITIEKHFCGDFLVDVSYFGKTKGCADEPGEDDCDKPEVIQKKNCCKDEVQQIEGQDDLQTATKKVTIEKEQQFLIAFIHSYNNLFLDLKKQIDSNQEYSPPKLIFDIQLLHEVFII